MEAMLQITAAVLMIAAFSIQMAPVCRLRATPLQLWRRCMLLLLVVPVGLSRCLVGTFSFRMQLALVDRRGHRSGLELPTCMWSLERTKQRCQPMRTE